MTAGYTLSDDHARLDFDVIHAFLSQAYWSPGVPRAVVERAAAQSVTIGAYDAAQRQVGYARAVTDHATFAWVADVFVLPEHRGQGLGRRMVQALLGHVELQGLRRWMLATADAHGVYAALGFTKVEGSDRFMELRRDPAMSHEVGARRSIADS